MQTLQRLLSLLASSLTTQQNVGMILSDRVSGVLRPARHIGLTGHFRDESFQAITCTGTDNSKQTGEHTPKTQNKLTVPR